MPSLTPQDTVLILLALGVILASASILGEVARRFSLPPLVGELLAGVLLGPTVLGRLWPGDGPYLPWKEPPGALLAALTDLAVALLLLVAGMQVRLSTIWRSGKIGLAVASFAVPFTIGLAAAIAAPYRLGCELDADVRIFALFFAAAMSISAPSVVTQALVELDLSRSELGRAVSAASVLAALTGWFFLSTMLGLIDQTVSAGGVARQMAVVVLFAALMLTAGRRLVDRALAWMAAYSRWPGGFAGLVVALALVAAGISEWMGIHYSVGPFLVGIAVGDSPSLRHASLRPGRQTVVDFVSYVIAPLLFGTVGLRVDFAEKFFPVVIVLVVVIACLGKLVGCSLAARIGGMPWDVSWAVGFAMNARGAMLTVFGLLALESGLIRPRMFVALVLLAAVSSAISEPVIARLLRRRRPLALADYLEGGAFVGPLRGGDRWDAIVRLHKALGLESTAERPDAPVGEVANARFEWAGPNQEVALCLVGSCQAASPRIAVGVAPDGIDFAPLADTPVYLVVLVVTPLDDLATESEIEAELVRSLDSEDVVAQLRLAQSHIDVLAALRWRKLAAHEDRLEVPVA